MRTKSPQIVIILFFILLNSTIVTSYGQDNSPIPINEYFHKLKVSEIIDTSYFKFKEDVFYSEVIDLTKNRYIIKNYDIGEYSEIIHLNAWLINMITNYNDKSIIL